MEPIFPKRLVPITRCNATTVESYNSDKSFQECFTFGDNNISLTRHTTQQTRPRQVLERVL